MAWWASSRHLGLVSVASSRTDSVVFVLTVRGAQRYRVELTVDSQGLIDNLTTKELPSTASPASTIPTLACGWVAQAVTFEAGGVTIHGTYTHPGAATATAIPAAVLLGGSGSTTDRNDNSPDQPNRNTLEAVANCLAADGVASVAGIGSAPTIASASRAPASGPARHGEGAIAPWACRRRGLSHGAPGRIPASP